MMCACVCVCVCVAHDACAGDGEVRSPVHMNDGEEEVVGVACGGRSLMGKGGASLELQ